MKKIILRIALLFFIASSVALANAPEVLAGQAVFPVDQPLHFNNGVNGSSWSGFLMTPSKDPNESAATGYVLPNMQGSSYSPAGGAIGETALGVNRYSTSNYDKKVALFCFLQKKNGVSQANRNSICTGDWIISSSESDREWERMGSALIVHQLIKTSPAVGRPATMKTITAVQWDELKRRLVDNTDVVMSYDPAWTTFRWNGKTFAGYYMSDLVNTAGVIMNSGKNVYDAMSVTYGRSDSTDDKTDKVWQFTSASDPSKIYYALVLNCANPIGGLLGLPDPPDPTEYSLTPSLTSPADGGTVKRGGTVSSDAKVKNNGPDDAGTKNWYITRLLYGAGVTPANKTARDTNTNVSDLCAEFSNDDGCSAATRSELFPNGQERTGTLSYAVPSGAAPGSQVCFVASVKSPTQNANPVWRHSAMRCVTVAPPEYSLVPSVRIDGAVDGSVLEPGEAIDVTNIVTNTSGDNESSKPTVWRLTRFVYTPSASLTVDDKKGNYSASDPCGFFKSAGRESGTDGCNTVQERTTQVFAPNDQTTFDPKYREDLPADKPVGTKICFAVSVKPPTYTDDRWRHSNLWCITLGKEPKMQVWGGDVRSGGKIEASTSTIEGRTYGSWVEYAALSMESNIGFSSGWGLSGGATSSGQSSWSKLTFANTGTAASCTFGCYDFSLTTPAVSSQFSTDAEDELIGGTRSLDSLDGTYRAVDLTISASAISGGRTIIIVATNEVTIQGDIVYEDKEYSDPSKLPQVIIKAPIINIKNSARRVDAWLLAVKSDGAGALNTCSDYGIDGDLADNRCNNALVINGPVMADTVYLRRTAGSGTTAETRGDPAEIFNLRADAYLWGSAYNKTRDSQIQTVYTKELSPRL